MSFCVLCLILKFATKTDITMTIDELRSAAAIVRDATEEGENTATRIGQLFLDMVNTLCNVSTNAIKGYVVISSTSDLPTSPTTDQQMKGYLLDTTLYVWVGTGGDTLDGKYQSAQLKGPQGNPGVSLGDVVLVNDLTTGGEGNALSAEMGKTLKGLIDSKTIPIVNDLTTGGEASALSAEQGKVLKGMIDDVSVKHGTFADALDAILASNSVFEWLLVDEVDSGELIKPLWHINGSLVDAAGAVVSLATLTAPVFSIDSGDVYVGTTVTITCTSGSTLYYSVNGVVATSTTDVTITINEASVVKAYLKSGDAVSDIVAKSYGIAIDHKFQFKIKLTGDNSTEYVPVVSSGNPKYTMTVDWGDGTTNEYSNQGFYVKGCGHTYSGTAGDEFIITLRGSAIPYLAFAAPLQCNVAALVAILDNTLECVTEFSNNGASGSYGFKDCINLESMSANALSNSNTINIQFRGCTKLTSLPTGFFANLHNLISCTNMFWDSVIVFTDNNIAELKTAIKNVTSFYSMFYSFDGSITVPDDFFEEVTASITDVSSAFGSIPQNNTNFYVDAKATYDVLVTKIASGASTSNCFASLGNNVANRNQVPNSWGGTAG